MNYDVMIIGGGPGGYTAALKAAKNGLKTILFEKDKVGGTCLNRGCIPMKSIIESARIYENSINSKLYGISNENTTFNYHDINTRRDEVVSSLRSGIENALNKLKVETVYGQAKISDIHKITCNNEVYEGENIIIASGSKVAIPPIEGIETAISSDNLLQEDFNLPESLIIIGGGVIGVEIASALSSLGCKITILEMADTLIPTMDKDLGQRLGMFFKKKGIDVYCSVKVNKVSDGKQVTYLDKNDNEVVIDAEKVLVATGRRSLIDCLDIDLETNRGIVGDKDGKTNYDNIYVIGDAKDNNIQLAHVAEAQGENIIDHLLNKEMSNDMNVIPSGIYTKPEIAVVGKSEEELKKDNIAYITKKYLTGANGKSLIENSESGFVKLIIVDQEIVGGQIISEHATELIGEIAIAISKKLKVEELGEVIHPHPSISEMIWHVAKD